MFKTKPFEVFQVFLAHPVINFIYSLAEMTEGHI
jgi:hypothetical protein